MSDVDYEPFPGEPQAIPYRPDPDGDGDPRRWNRFALWSFGLPIVLFVLGYAAGEIVASTYGFTTGLGSTFLFTMIGSGVEVAGYVVGIVLGHRSLSTARRGFRGRGFGFAGLALNYVSVVWALISVVVVISSYISIQQNMASLLVPVHG